MMTDELLADLRVAVDQQILSPETPYVGKAYDRLIKLGVEATEARTQIALCLGEEMDRILRTKKPFEVAAYQASLEALPLEEDEQDEATEA
jgi:hypothetical protein